MDVDQSMKDASKSLEDFGEEIRQSSAFGRSVVDYETPEQLRQALQERMEKPIGPCEQPPEGKSDWLLPVPDPEAEPQTVSSELQRLLTLKSYLLLDQDKEEAFDQLTREACQVYNVPTSLISLIDLGRQFLFSNTGGGDVKETSRSSAFCSHTILSKRGICVVPDTLQDPRFRNNCLVEDGPKLRFYAGAPLISPEGYKLGTFCVEGPDPRPEGLTEAEQERLKEFARKAMQLMVERRRVMQKAVKTSNLPEYGNMRDHAAVTTNLGNIVYKLGETVIAMSLFQESVQTLMLIEEDSSNVKIPSKERRERIAGVFESLKAAAKGTEPCGQLLQELRSLFPETSAHPNLQPVTVATSIPGMFHMKSNLKGSLSNVQQQGLSYSEAFEVSMEPFDPIDKLSKLDDRAFIIPLEQCSKATLFNMGLIHYYWGQTDNAMQFFDLAASLSQPHEATNFDPVILASLNNMAQINLQFGRADDAMGLLSDALTRGNAALHAIYDETAVPESFDGENDAMQIAQEDIDVRRTKRLRKKLARTLLGIAQVHFYNSNYDHAMQSCQDALMLLHTDKEEVEVAAAWYDISLLYYHKGDYATSLAKLELFLDVTKKALPAGPNLQLASALTRKGKTLYEVGRVQESIYPLNEALLMRRELAGNEHPAVAETLFFLGKALMSIEHYDYAGQALDEALSIQRNAIAKAAALFAEDQVLSLDLTHTLVELGRVHHAKGNVTKSLETYMEVAELTRKIFGLKHPFVAQIDTIIGNLCSEIGDVENSFKHFENALQVNKAQGLAFDLNVVKDPAMRGRVQQFIASSV